MRFFKPLVFCLKKLEMLSSLSCRLVRLTNKSSYCIHPKHLINKKDEWYLKYIEKNDTILDIGCNNGQNTIKAAIKCHKIIGFDIDNKVLDVAKKGVQKLKLNNVQFLCFNAESKIPFKNNNFNKVFCFAVLEHLKNRSQLLQEIRRVLKENGLLLLSVPNKETTWKKIQKDNGLFYYSDPDHKVEYNRKTITDLLRLNGYKLIKFSPVALDMPGVGLIDLIGGLSLTIYKLFSKWRKQIVQKFPDETVSFEIVAKKTR